MDRRLLHLHHRRKPPQLLHRKRVLHHYTLRHVSHFLSVPLHSCIDIVRSPLYLLGYIPAHNRVYLVDKDVNVYSYSLSLSMVEYQTAVLRGDMEAASEILPSIPKEHRNKIATFLEGRGTVARKGSVMSVLTPTCRAQGTRAGSHHRPGPEVRPLLAVGRP